MRTVAIVSALAAAAAVVAVSAPAATPAPAVVNVAYSAPADDTTAPSVPQTPGEIAYLFVVRQASPRFQIADTSNLLSMAHDICGMLDGGMTSPQIGIISMADGLTAAEAGTMVGSATSAYCPQYSALVQAQFAAVAGSAN